MSVISSIGCPECEGTKTIYFNWINPTKDYVKYLNTVVFTRQLKHGKLFQCVKCHFNWFLDGDGMRMYSFPSELTNLLDKWDSRSLVPSREIYLALREIGATPPDVYGNGKDCVQIPCRCVTKDKEEIDFCLASFQKTPPLVKGRRYLFVDKVERISTSDYALSKKVRLATSGAEEIRMGLSPTYVKAKDGNIFLLNGMPEFFYESGYKGQDLSLLSIEDFRRLEKGAFPKKSSNFSNNKITYIIADGMSNSEDLRICVPGYMKALRKYWVGSNSVKEFAEKLGISIQDISFMKTGEKMPSVELANRIILYAHGRPITFKDRIMATSVGRRIQHWFDNRTVNKLLKMAEEGENKAAK